MTTNQIINLDCREKKNQEIIQKVLKKIKPLLKYSDENEVPFGALEKVIMAMCKKYCVCIKEIVPDVWSNDKHIIYRATLINDTNFKIIGKVYGISIYEVFAKIAIKLYSEVKKGIEIRSKGVH